MRRAIRAIGLFFLLAYLTTPSISAASPLTHKVRQGENLYSIAKKYHVSVVDLKNLNNLRSAKLSLGQTLLLKDSEPDKTAKKELHKQYTGKKSQTQEIQVGDNENDGEFIEYKVKRGDTVDTVAKRFNVDRDELIESNNLQSAKGIKRLSPGRAILIPRMIEEGEEEIVTLTNKPLKPWKDGDEKYMLVKVAKSFMGAPYKYGGNTVKGLDCSAFVKKIYEIFDIQLPRSARDQFKIGSKVARDALAVGDLVFFKTKRYAKYPTHVGIYIGEDNFIHSSSGHGRIGVKIDSLSTEYYAKAYIGATRIKDSSFEEVPEAATTSDRSSRNL
ncbi:MAG TPA: NlpC/P60 family protein [Syntrophorhabdaceae bacterium]|nr:NlpC/P60 family protein [Syntrophorhabdaceae bacterium]